MAAFTDPANALDAALAIRDDIAAFNRHLAAETGAGVAILVKIGLYSGACIAVTLNDRLDYFGSTVNLAARLQGRAPAVTSWFPRRWPPSRRSRSDGGRWTQLKRRPS